MKYKTLDDFLDLQSHLLDVEHDTEVNEQKELYESLSLKHLENSGVCLRHVTVDHQKTGLYGRFVVTFAHSKGDDPSKGGKEESVSCSHRFSSGDIVGLYPNKGEQVDEISSGVVSYVRGTSITVAFDQDFDVSLIPMYRLMKLTNGVTHKRLKRALDDLRKLPSSSPCSSLLEQVFPCKPASNNYAAHSEQLVYFNDDLDASQKNAIDFVLHNQQKISVIHGPPGTGKTTSVVEVVKQAVKRYSLKVLVCAPSNIAVDNLVDKLAKGGLKVIRLGHPARVVGELQKYSLDAVLTNRDSSDIIMSVRTDISSTIGQLKKCRNKGEVIALRKEIKSLKKELRTRESKAMKEVLTGADVILSTLNSASRDGPLKHLPDEHFKLLVIDEAAQALEVSCWIPMMQSPRLILVGDHKQLPPTIISRESANKGLAITLLERVIEGHGENIVAMLTTQYRMHEDIMRWPSAELYDNKLIAADSVAKHLLCDLPDVIKTIDTMAPVVFVDTAGFSLFEQVVDGEQSKANMYEVEIVKDHVDALVQAGVQTKHIGVITPYNLQVKMLRKSINLLYPSVEVRSVDGFQGREKEAILISMVRSNEKGEIGFLSEDRRMNVALTRARRHLFVVGDSETASHNPFLKSMCQYLQVEGDLRFAHNTAAMNIPTTVPVEQYELPAAVLRSKSTQLKHTKNKEQNLAGDASDTTTTTKPQHTDTCKGNDGSNVDILQQQHDDHSAHIEQQKAIINTEDIFKQIEEFSTNNNKQEEEEEEELVFPCSLSAKERAFVHEMADQFGLLHVSCGDGVERKIVVSRITANSISRSSNSVVESTEANTLKPDATKLKSEEANTSKLDKAEKVIKVEGHLACEICTVYVPAANYQLHLIRCRNADRAKEIRAKEKEEQKKSAAVAKKKNKTKENKSQQAKEEEKEEEDVDAVLASFAKTNSRCRFPKCKIPIKTLGQKCAFCSQMYCLSHHQAEVHGCGEACKIRARQDISKYKGHVPVKMNGIKKAQVQNKLNAKLSKLEEQRLKSKKEKENN